MATRHLVVLSIAAALALAACGGRGGGSQAPPSGQEQTIDVTAVEFKFTPASVTAKGGRVTFNVKNDGQIAHNFKIRGRNAGVETIEPGHTATVTADLAPGTYEFYCDIPGHADAGMKGTVTVSQ